MPIHASIVYIYVQYSLRNSEFWRVCLLFTNAYDKVNVLDLYDTNSFKISLLYDTNGFKIGLFKISRST